MKSTPDQSSDLPESAPQPKRRGLLLGAGAAIAGGTVAVVASRSGVEPAAAAGQQARADDAGGYRLTDHVRRYYETART
ncbi:MAG: formate dehydrogenase [Piscinibacter sp.]|nr:formate dehydrogenase [Piscinibacter sp.]